MAMNFLIGEYRVLWEALKRYQTELAVLSDSATDEDAQLLADDKLQKIEDMLLGIAVAAKSDWEIDLE
ncbi:hypothetical protein [Roseateles depolymerans]|uniref:Uncharacterized protein n=1 Tax=Roseateles depolymerans TaxID=76731 RepID=A0A0U3N011_9BURK|nr:hypothetical protein [Roseateles depolymerans]ALV07508.1 hypothetical protein RD2015_3047 [Roseateles depolymerans]REG22276.1 hypothetical protein DES44_1420 [Roseateles depolymerans]